MRSYAVAFLLATVAGCATVHDDKPAAAQASLNPGFVYRSMSASPPPQMPPADVGRVSDPTSSGSHLIDSRF